MESSINETFCENEFWVLTSASRTMQKYVALSDPLNYNREVRKYETPRKIIKLGSQIVIVALTENIWGGIKAFNSDDINITETKFIKKRGTGTTILDVENYYYSTGKTVITKTPKGGEIEHEEFKVSPQFYSDIIKTGYVTEKEIADLMNEHSTRFLPRLEFINS